MSASGHPTDSLHATASLAFGGGGVISAGWASTTESLTLPIASRTLSVTATDDLTADETATNLLEGDSVSDHAHDVQHDAATLTDFAYPWSSLTDVAATTFGAGGIPTSATDGSTASATQTDVAVTNAANTDSPTETDTESNTQGSIVLLLVSDFQKQTVTDTVNDTNTNAVQVYAASTLTAGAGAVISSGSGTGITTATTTDALADTETGTATASHSESYTLSLTGKSVSESPTSTETVTLTASETASATASSAVTATELLGTSGTVASGLTTGGGSGSGGDSDSLHETGTDTAGGGASLAYAARIGTTYNAGGSDSGSGTLTADDSGSLTASASDLFALSLAAGGSIFNGFTSVSNYTSASSSLSATATLTDTATTSVSDADSLTATATLTETASAHIGTSETASNQALWNVTTGGTIAGGSVTATVSTGSSESYGGTDTGSETDTDTESSREVGTVTGSAGGSADSSLYEVTALTYGLGGAITGGSMSYTLGNTVTSSLLPHADTASSSFSQGETGTASFADQAGGAAETGAFSRSTSATSSFSAYEVGSLVFGSAGTVASGGDSFTWAQNAYLSSSFYASGTSLSVTEYILESFSQSETGTETIGSGGSLAGGSDSFSWIQSGSNSASLNQHGASGTHSWSYSYGPVFWGGSWNDQGGDTFGPGGTTTAGTDFYLWDSKFSLTDSVSDGGTSVSNTQYILWGSGGATSSTHDAGVDSLAGGSLTGHDTYSFNETSNDTYGASGYSGTSLQNVAYTIGNSNSMSYSDGGTLANDIATPTSSDSYILWDADNPSYNVTVGDTATNHPNICDSISSAQGYTLGATGGDSVSGTHSLGSVNFGYTQLQSTIHGGSDFGYDGTSSFHESLSDNGQVTNSVTGSSSFSDGVYLKTSSALLNLADASNNYGSVGTVGNSYNEHDATWQSTTLSATNVTSSTTATAGGGSTTNVSSGTEDSVIATDYGTANTFYSFPLPPVGASAAPGKLFAAVEALAARNVGYAPRQRYVAGVSIQDQTTSYGFESYLSVSNSQTGTGTTFSPTTAIQVGYRRGSSGIVPTGGGTGASMPAEDTGWIQTAANGLLDGAGGGAADGVLEPTPVPVADRRDQAPGRAQLPSDKRGTWEGVKGDGVFQYSDTLQNRADGLVGKQVRFKNQHIGLGGFPAEIYYEGNAAAASVPIKTITGTPADDAAADAAKRLKRGDPNWQRPKGYLWNHAGDSSSTTMELVDADAHSKIHHQGSAAEPRAKLRAKGGTAKAVAGLAIYVTLRDAAKASGLLQPDYVERNADHYFVASDGSVFIVQTHWWSGAWREFVAGPRKGQTEGITAQDVKEYRKQAEAVWGRYDKGSLFRGPRFIPGTQRARLAITDEFGRETGYVDEDGVHLYDRHDPEYFASQQA